MQNLRLKKYPEMVSVAVFRTGIVTFLTVTSNRFIFEYDIRTVFCIWSFAMYDVSQIQNLQKCSLLSMLIASQITQAQTLLEGSCSDAWPFFIGLFVSILLFLAGNWRGEREDSHRRRVLWVSAWNRVVDPGPWDPYVFGPPGSGSGYLIICTDPDPSTSIIKEKYFVTSFWLFILVISKKFEIKLNYCWHLVSHKVHIPRSGSVPKCPKCHRSTTLVSN